MTRPRRVLFISNGHGEDNHSAHVIRALRQRDLSVEVEALPIVGTGSAYGKIGVPIVGPTLDLPSGGFTYMDRRLLWGDIRAGMVGLTVGQIRAMRRAARGADLVHATGDTVGQSFAWTSGKPFISFISCLSALYEGTLRIEPILRGVLRSRRCLHVVTRDPLTAEDLTAQGFRNVVFGGIPSLDWLQPTGADLGLRPGVPMVALLPGSRQPEASRNFALMMRLVRHARGRSGDGVQFRAALVPSVVAELPALAAADGWRLEDDVMRHEATGAEIGVRGDAFADIVQACRLVIGMAGLAVDQAVALGRPVIQIAGPGPQFTWRFAEAQERLLGLSARTIGRGGPATEEDLRQGAALLAETLADEAYLRASEANGRARLGAPGASFRVADLVLGALERAVSGA
jgi:uncharacterized protein (TIGR03492 family)